MASMAPIPENLQRLRARLAAAALSAGRLPESVALVAVSKTQPAEAVLQAYAAGQRLFGENRVQEASVKFTPLRATCPDIHLQLIGPLQTNKVSDAVRLFDSIATLDRPKLAETLAQAMAKHNRRPALFIEVNLAAEPQKTGIAPEELPAFLEDCCERLHLPVVGLMCLPPHNQDPRPHFEQLARLAEQAGLPECSMGMSADFETAIACGSTQVRLGTALFGVRPPAP